MKYSKFAGVILCGCLFFNSEINGQDTKELDSLKTKLDNSVPETRIDLFLKICLYYNRIDDVKMSIIYVDKGLELAKVLRDSFAIVHCNRIKGQLLAKEEKINESIATQLAMLPIARRHGFDRETSFILNSLGVSYIYNADYAKALNYTYQSLIMKEEKGDQDDISIGFHNLGFIYLKIDDYVTALDYFKRSLELKLKIGSKTDLSVLLINISICYFNLGDSAATQAYVRRATTSCGPKCDKRVQAGILLVTANTFILKNDLGQAEEYLRKAYKLSSETNYGDLN